MKIIKYFLLTVLAVWVAILGIYAIQNRNKNPTYRKIKGWLDKEIKKEPTKDKFGIEL